MSHVAATPASPTEGRTEAAQGLKQAGHFACLNRGEASTNTNLVEGI